MGRAAASAIGSFRGARVLWILAAATLLVYAPAVTNDFVNWDDDHYAYENPSLRERSLAGLAAHFLRHDAAGPVLPNVMGNYHPLTMVSLHLDHWLSTSDPTPRPDRETSLRANVFHATNVLLHVANTLLVFFAVRALVVAHRQARGGTGRDEADTLAGITALLFGVTTLHVESVAWISERKDVLYTLFFLIALLAYVEYTQRRRRGLYAVALAAFLLALLAKGQAVTLAAVLVLVDFALSRPIDRRVVAEKVPFFLLALVFGLAAVKAQRDGGNVLLPDAAGPVYERLGFAAFGFVQYVVKLVAPYDLRAHYSYASARAVGPALFLVYLPAAVVLLVFGGSLARRSRLLGFGVAFFVVTLAPVLQLLPVGRAVMADRYSYVPSIGLFLLVAAAVLAVLRRWPRHAPALVALGVVYVVGIGAMTLTRVTAWRNSLTLWTEELRRDPASAIAHNNLATYRFKTGNPAGALEAVNRAVDLDPRWARAYANRAMILEVLGRSDLARADYDRTLALDPDQPLVLNNRGKERQHAGDLAGAAADFTRAIELSPPSALFYANRAEVYAAQGRLAEAIDDYSRALALDPPRPDLLGDRAVARAQAGDTRGALDDFSAVVRLLPESPHAYLNRARARLGTGDCAGAVEDLQAVTRLGAPVPEAARRAIESACPGAGLSG